MRNKIFLHKDLYLITCVTQIVLKWKKSIRSTLVIKLHVILEQKFRA